MSLVLKDRVKETTSTQGTGTITLLGAVQGYQAFSSIGNGNTTYYCIQGTSDWEVGIGTVGAGTLTRDTVLASSNSGSLVGFGSGVKDVFCTYPASKSVSTDTLPVTGAFNTASPNATVNVASLTSAVSTTNGDIALVPKGTGAKLAQVPDGATAGGNKRGVHAVDWQTLRAFATDVASGDYSVVGGGYSNRSSGSSSVIGGGSSNDATALYATVGGGGDNEATATGATVAGGSGNEATALYAFVGSGRFNIASGQYSAICAGYEVLASGNYSVINGGQTNTASAAHSSVGGGLSNTNSGQYSAIAGGWLNTVSNSTGFIGGGYSNTVSGSSGVVCGGSTNVASAGNSFIGSGYENRANSSYGTIVGGTYGTTRGIVGYQAYPACAFPIASVVGVSQGGLLILARQTTNATPTVIRSTNTSVSATNQLILPNESAVYFKGTVIATENVSYNTKSWTFDGQIKRGANAASTVLTGSTVSSPYADAGASTWSVALSADTFYGGLAVTVTGAVGVTIRWVCKIETTEVTF